MSDKTIRVIVFEESGRFVAQCLEYDICVEAGSIPLLLDRLELTIEAEIATCEATGKNPLASISAAPSHYSALWERRSVQLKRIDVSAVAADGKGVRELDIGMIDTSRAAA